MLLNVTDTVAMIFAALLAYICARAIVSGKRSQATLDASGGLRKLHAIPTPRIGGMAVALGLFAGATINSAMTGRLTPWLFLFVCIAPAFVWGLIEDLSKRGAVLPRLVLPAVAAALGFILLDARLVQLDIPGLDDILAVHAFAFLFTAFAVTGVTHAVNVIDGLNGLAGVTALLVSIGLAIVAAFVNDSFIFSVACVLAGSLVGFLIVNYPSGRIFLGDGGAYLVGLALAELSVLLVHRNSEVSPWFPLMLLVYPIWETLFSMYRRRIRGQSTAHADALHLHTLIYRRIVRWHGFSGNAAQLVARNSIASLCLWTIPLACFGIALAFWDNSVALQISAVAFVGTYGLSYRALVRFRVPTTLVLRAPRLRGTALDRADDAVDTSRLGH